MHSSVLLIVLLLSLGVQSQNTYCETVIKVRRNTIYTVPPGKPLRINCTVEFCNSVPPVVSWKYSKGDPASSTIINDSTRIHTKWARDKFKFNETNSTGVFQLDFDYIITNDSGLYSCQSGGSVGHFINVTLADSFEVSTVTLRNNTSSATEESRENSESDIMRQYVYPLAGIVGFVIIVIIVSVLAMRGCKGKRMKKEQTDNQYTSVPMSHQPPPQPRIQPHPRQSLPPHQSSPGSTYDNAPLRRASQQQATPMATASIHSTASGDQDHTYSTARKQAQRGKKTLANDEQESSLLYATLNHQNPGARVQPPRPTEETSEYAAIRVGFVH